MTKYFDFKWKVEPDKILLDGATFDRWYEEKEDTEYDADCVFKVDEFGFFITWKKEGKEGQALELSQISDIRWANLPKDRKLMDKVLKNGNDVTDRMLAICTNLDYVNIKMHNIICKTKDEALKWQTALRKVTNNNKINNVCPKTNLKKHWIKLCSCTDNKGNVPIKGIVKTFASGKTEKLVFSNLKTLGLPNTKGESIPVKDFTFEKFYKLYQLVCPRTDIDELFSTITKGEFINTQTFINFMNDKQRDPSLNQILYPMYDQKRVMEIIEMHEPTKDNIQNKRLSKQGLLEYMMSDENAPVFLDRLDIYQDMTQELPHYYVNSSHNTYLSGKQIGGKSTAEMYRQTLLAGCRCVELDFWDGKGEDQEPIITHGKAMCTEITAKEAIEAIRDCAFVTSDYPIILSFENHCCKTQQYKLAKYCDEIFGDLLSKEPLPEYPLGPGQPMPPPNALLRKILIKNKRLKPEVEKEEMEKFLSGEEIADEEGAVEDASKPAEVAAPAEPDPAAAAAAAPDAAAGGAPGAPGADSAAAAQYKGTSNTNIHPYLSSMVNYGQPVHFNGFEAAKKKNIHHNMSSFSETTAMNYLKQDAIEFVNYNKRQISRIYPKGTRADSSNYMPQMYWNAGCQLVSLNFQTTDLPMQLNQGKFEYNGNCGYLLKPTFMRATDKTFDPFSGDVDGVVAQQVTVNVIAGQFLSDKKTGTYVEVDMYGLPSDTVRKEFRTRVVPANALNPQYNEEPFVFRKVSLPDLAVIRIAVFTDEGKMLGQRILPLDGLQIGYRHISLRTEGNFPMSLPMLFCNINVQIYVPEGLGDFMDALSDPNAAAKAAAQRSDQMASIGIEAADDKKKDKKEEKKKEEVVWEPITIKVLRESKVFQKATKSQQKDIDKMKKKHMKERTSIQKSQCSAIDKASKGKGLDAVADDANIKSIVEKQMDEWTDMMEKHRKEEWTMLRTHMAGQEDVLRTTMEAEQAAQMKKMDDYNEQCNKDLKAEQAKTAVETAKEINNDKKLKSKAEKERRLKEKSEMNTKRFIEARKTEAIRQGKAKDKLEKAHKKQLAQLSEEIKATINFYEMCDKDYEKYKKKEFFC